MATPEDKGEVIRVQDATELALHAADLIIQAAKESIRARGRFTIALAGGSTPEKTYALLAEPEYVARLDWTKTYVFFSDERFVPPSDERSNLRMAFKSLLAHIRLAPGHLFPVPTDRPQASVSASEYNDTLRSFFQSRGAPPRFDMILLGMGDDGHTASLFPGAPSLEVRDQWVVSSPPGTLPPPVDRITFTFPVINAARAVLFMISGQNKADALRDVLQGHEGRQTRPAVAVHPTDGTLTWLIDNDAASALAPK